MLSLDVSENQAETSIANGAVQTLKGSYLNELF